MNNRTKPSKTFHVKMQQRCKDKFGKQVIGSYLSRVIGTKPDDKNKMNTQDNAKLATAIENQPAPLTNSKEGNCRVKVIKHADIRKNELLYLVMANAKGEEVIINIGVKTFTDVKKLVENG